VRDEFLIRDPAASLKGVVTGSMYAASTIEERLGFCVVTRCMQRGRSNGDIYENGTAAEQFIEPG
jgi:hypothetical protein